MPPGSPAPSHPRVRASRAEPRRAASASIPRGRARTAHRLVCAGLLLLVWTGFQLMSRFSPREGLTPWDVAMLRYAGAFACALPLLALHGGRASRCAGCRRCWSSRGSAFRSAPMPATSRAGGAWRDRHGGGAAAGHGAARRRVRGGAADGAARAGLGSIVGSVLLAWTTSEPARRLARRPAVPRGGVLGGLYAVGPAVAAAGAGHHHRAGQAAPVFLPVWWLAAALRHG